MEFRDYKALLRTLHVVCLEPSSAHFCVTSLLRGLCCFAPCVLYPLPKRVTPLVVGKLCVLKIPLNLVGSVQEVNGLPIYSLTYSTHFRLNLSPFNYLLC